MSNRSDPTADEGATPTAAWSDVERRVKSFYDSYGWVDQQGTKGEDELFRIFRPAYEPYHREVERRTEGALRGWSGRLLVAGCGDLPDSHVRIASRFESVCCLDISSRALRIAREKLGRMHQYVEASILDIPLADDSLDAVFCAHVIYHIDIARQERAIDELIRVTRPGGRVAVVYSNPRSPLRHLAGASSRLRRVLKRTGPATPGRDRPPLYFARHPLRWWRRFEDRCSIAMQPWDAIGSYEERLLIGSDRVATMFYAAAGRLERAAPGLAVRLWQYPLVLPDKRMPH